MKNLIQKFALGILLSVASAAVLPAAHAADVSSETDTIASLEQLSQGTINVYLKTKKPGCLANQAFFVLNATQVDTPFKTTLLAALLSGRSVKFDYSCEAFNIPIITAVRMY